MWAAPGAAGEQREGKVSLPSLQLQAEERGRRGGAGAGCSSSKAWHHSLGPQKQRFPSRGSPGLQQPPTPMSTGGLAPHGSEPMTLASTAPVPALLCSCPSGPKSRRQTILTHWGQDSHARPALGNDGRPHWELRSPCCCPALLPHIPLWRAPTVSTPHAQLGERSPAIVLWWVSPSTCLQPPGHPARCPESPTQTYAWHGNGFPTPETFTHSQQGLERESHQRL